jgi:hypothetical protein
MTQNLRQPTLLLCASFLCASLLAATGARAQSLAPDEAVGPDGTVMQKLQFSPVERSAIVNAAAAQRVRGPSGLSRGVTAAIGAPVPPTLSLHDLPDQAAFGAEGGPVLKYAMMEDEIVVVDPIRMRVVDVIRSGVRRYPVGKARLSGGSPLPATALSRNSPD